MADVNDTGNVSGRLQRAIDKIETAAIHDADRPALRDYATWCRRHVSSGNTAAIYINAVRLSSARHDTPIVEVAGVNEVERIIDAHEDAGCRKAGSLNSKLDGLRDFWRWCESTEYGLDDYRWVTFVKNVESSEQNPGTPLPDPEFILGEEELVALQQGASSFREKALIAFLADTGARITLATQLRRRDVSPDAYPPTFRPNQHGAGHKDVATKDYVLKESAEPIRTYLEEAHPDDHPDAPLFALRKGYDPDDRRHGALARASVYDRLNDAAEAAGIQPQRARPHQIRKAAVARMRLKHEMSWDAIQKRMEWSDQSLPEMKEIYRAIDNSAEIEMVAKELGYDEESQRSKSEAVTELAQALEGWDIGDIDDLTSFVRSHGAPADG